MAQETLKEIFYDNSKVIVEVARRDIQGRLFDTTYVTKSDLEDELDKLETYTLPAATTTTLGGVIIGSGLIVDSNGLVKVDEISWSSITNKPFASINADDFTISEEVIKINDEKFITKTALTEKLEDYYDKETINNLFTQLKKATIQVVSALPEVGEEGVIYLVGESAPYTMYVFEEAAYINLGTTEINLDGYVKGDSLTSDTLIVGAGGSNIKASSYTVGGATLIDSETILPTSKAITTALATKQDKLTAGNGITIQDNTISSVITASDITLDLED